MNDTQEFVDLTSAAHISIANLHFEIDSPELPLLQKSDHIYPRFIESVKNQASISISVTILPGEILPLLEPLKKIFDTEQSWAMYSDSQHKFIARYHSDKNRTPRWLAKLNPDHKEVTVYCSIDEVRKHQGQDMLLNPVLYPLDQLLLIHFLAGTALLVHAAGVIIDGRGYLFAGHSGAGKSTLSNLLLKYKEFTTLSDDRIVIRKDGQDLLMYGTPWPGEAEIAVNDCARLHGIFFLNHSEDNSIEELAPAATLKYLFKVSSLPWYDKNDLKKSLDFCDDLLKNTKMYELNFKPGPEIVEYIMSFIS